LESGIARGDGGTESHTGYPTKCGQQEGFGEELAPYVGPRTTQCPAETDLVAPFDYRDLDTLFARDSFSFSKASWMGMKKFNPMDP